MTEKETKLFDWALETNCTTYVDIKAHAKELKLAISHDSIWALVNYVQKNKPKPKLVNWGE